MREAIPYGGGELEVTRTGDVWQLRLGELEESSRYLDYALARLLDVETRTAHELATRLVEELTVSTYTYVVVLDGVQRDHLYRDERRQVIEREVLAIDGHNVVAEQVRQPDGGGHGWILAHSLPRR